ncbi:MAG TPA: hypothetical protein VG733_20330 [Chthoniobacteraceae bacterium]|nr:hypothetical protein [Chthoniobacteraceae bacterium]
MNDSAPLLQIEQEILRSLTGFNQPPDLPEIAEKLGITTNAGQIKLSYYVDHLEQDGFMKYNRAWLHSHVYDERAIGWNLTSKGRSYLAEQAQYGLS